MVDIERIWFPILLFFLMTVNYKVNLDYFFSFVVKYAVIRICTSYPENFHCPTRREKWGPLLTCNQAVTPEVFLAQTCTGIRLGTARQPSAKMKLLSSHRLDTRHKARVENCILANPNTISITQVPENYFHTIL